MPSESVWKDGIFYPNGLYGQGYGVKLVPIKRAGEIVPGEWAVIYPVVQKPGEVVPNVGGRPRIELTPKQLSYLTKQMTIREVAKKTGLSKSTVANLRKHK